MIFYFGLRYLNVIRYKSYHWVHTIRLILLSILDETESNVAFVTAILRAYVASALLDKIASRGSYRTELIEWLVLIHSRLAASHFPTVLLRDVAVQTWNKRVSIRTGAYETLYMRTHTYTRARVCTYVHIYIHRDIYIFRYVRCTYVGKTLSRVSFDAVCGSVMQIPLCPAWLRCFRPDEFSDIELATFHL